MRPVIAANAILYARDAFMPADITLSPLLPYAMPAYARRTIISFCLSFSFSIIIILPMVSMLKSAAF